MERLEIPQKSIYRVSLYGRCLERLHDNGHEMVSSAALAAAAGVKPSQLRRDLAYFGTFGTRGLGYPVEALRQAINEGLGRAKLQPVIMVGAGNLGRALLRYDGFKKEGYEVLAAFDAAVESLANTQNPFILQPNIFFSLLKNWESIFRRTLGSFEKKKVWEESACVEVEVGRVFKKKSFSLSS